MKKERKIQGWIKRKGRQIPNAWWGKCEEERRTKRKRGNENEEKQGDEKKGHNQKKEKNDNMN